MTSQLVQRLSNVGVLQTSLAFSEMGASNGITNAAVQVTTLDEIGLTRTILSTNLHAWFDAGNRASYPGTGVIWYDISGNGFAGIFTLIGTGIDPVGLYFDGVSSKIDTNVTDPTLPISMNFWVKPTSFARGIYDSSPNLAPALRHYSTSSPIDTAEWSNADPAVSTGLSPSTWQYLTVNYHDTGGVRHVDTYVNGVSVANGVGSPLTFYAWTSYVLGAIDNNTNWYGGYMGQVQLYNRLMTPAEIAWNYSVDAQRYGLSPSVDIYQNLPPGPTMPQPVAQRQINDGTLQVKGEFDEVTPI